MSTLVRKRRFQSSVCGPHELLDLRAMGPAAQGNRGTGKGSDSTCKHEQGQNNLLTARSRTQGHI